jgi:hypothetical protein
MFMYYSVCAKSHLLYVGVVTNRVHLRCPSLRAVKPVSLVTLLWGGTRSLEVRGAGL